MSNTTVDLVGTKNEIVQDWDNPALAGVSCSLDVKWELSDEDLANSATHIVLMQLQQKQVLTWEVLKL